MLVIIGNGKDSDLTDKNRISHKLSKLNSIVNPCTAEENNPLCCRIDKLVFGRS